MRVLIDLQACQTASRRRGIGRYSLALAEALARTEGRAEFSLLLNGAFPESVEWLRERFAQSVPRERIHVFDAPRPVAEMNPANQWRTQAAEAIREGRLQELNPDVVLLSSLFEGFVDDATTSVTSHPHRVDAATLYDLIPLVRPETLASPESGAWYGRKLASLRNIDLLLAISEHARDEALAAQGLLPERIAVISTAADACFRPMALDEDRVREIESRYGIVRPYVLYAGGFDARKNVPRLLDAFANLSPDVRDVHQLLLAGVIDERALGELRKWARRNGISNHVVFTGYVDDEELAALYNLCRVFVFPSLHEGFGLPVLEGMACGAAVIASNASSIPEVIGRPDALFDPSNVDAIGHRMHAVLTDENLRIELRRYGLERSTHFSWATTAQRALEALGHAYDRKHAGRAALVARSSIALPSLAFVSPLPPERTGVAFYSAELLAPLHKLYRIELVTDQQAIELPAELATIPVRTSAWFDAHAGTYDRTLYQLGNSPFHARMFELLDRHPGTAVMHDLFLGGVLNWMDCHGGAPGILSRWLFRSHGYPALVADRDRGRDATIDAYPCSWPLIENANGVIVHSTHALRLAHERYRIVREDWRRIGQLRHLPDLAQRERARSSLGLGPRDILVCSFGFIDATKLDERIVDAWLRSPLAADPRCSLVFVGENHGGEFGLRMSKLIGRASGRVRIAGYVDASTFSEYLLAADIAVQLRGISRGETSRTVLDCLAHGIPLIVNATGSLAELPDDVAHKMPADFSDDELARALATLAHGPIVRDALRERARRHVAEHHDPDAIALAFRDAIESFASGGPRARYRRVIESVARIGAPVDAEPSDWRGSAQSIAFNMRPPVVRQLLVDVSVLVKQDLKTGIERVVRAVLRELLTRIPCDWRVEPVIAAHDCYVYARTFTSAWLGVAPAGPDVPIDVAGGDIFIGLDWAADSVPDHEAVLQRYRTLGVTIAFVVYDLLPVLHPAFYPAGIDAMHAAWLSTVAKVADGALCISAAVADELLTWLDAHAPHRASSLEIDVLPLGADFERSAPTHGLPDDAAIVLERIAQRPTVLIVGTVEPRKAHAQALAGFELAWHRGVDVNLIIVGKQGWMVDDVAGRLRRHPETGHRLFWFESASDEWLDRLYATAGVLLVPSLGEGYGLPVIEAARHRLPLIVRDLPVFREVAGAHAIYFDGTSADDIASAIDGWLRADNEGRVPDSGNIAWRDWSACVDALLAIVLKDRWERRWTPANARDQRTAPGTIRRIDFSQTLLSPTVRTIRGLSGREPWGRWSDADVHPLVEIRFRDPLPARGSLSLTARAFGPNIGQPVRVRIGGHESELRFEASDTTVVASYDAAQSPQSIEIVAPHPARPLDFGGSQDPRRLGIGLVHLMIRSA